VSSESLAFPQWDPVSQDGTRASSIGSARLIHIDANRTISARSSGSFMDSASDKHSLAFARYALLAAIGTFSSQFPRDLLMESGSCFTSRNSRDIYFVPQRLVGAGSRIWGAGSPHLGPYGSVRVYGLILLSLVGLGCGDERGICACVLRPNRLITDGWSSALVRFRNGGRFRNRYFRHRLGCGLSLELGFPHSAQIVVSRHWTYLVDG
jgi:hypothetical protein